MKLEALDEILVRFSQLVIEQPGIQEIEINPLLVSADNIIALDARVALHDGSIPDEALPRPVIRPYPLQYVFPGVRKTKCRLRFAPFARKTSR